MTRLVLALVLAFLVPQGAAFAQQAAPPWSVPGFTVETYRHSLPDEEQGAGLRFTDASGKVAAEFPGLGQTETWHFITADIRLPGVTAPIAAFTHYSGGAHCCSAVELFTLGDKPTRLAVSPRQEGDGATIVETHAGWIVPAQDSSFAYGMDRAFANSPFPPVFWRLTEAGFVPAPELQKAGADGVPALIGQCHRPGRDEDGHPTCGSYAARPMTDADLTAAITQVVARAEGDVAAILRDLPAQAIEGIAEGRAIVTFGALAVAKAPPEVARKLVQAFAARGHWPQIMGLNGVEAMLSPLSSDGQVIAAAIAGDRPLLPLGSYGGETLGFVDLACDAEGHVRLLDAFGAGLGELTMIGCPRLTVPEAQLAEEAWSAAMVATGQDGGRGIVAITDQGGIVVPLDDQAITIDRFIDEDDDGRAEAVKLNAGDRTTTCPLIDVVGTMACIDQFSIAE